MSENLTPMMQQYRRIKAEIPADALLLFRLGDFYEMFFDDAKDASALLNLTLTKRNGVPMCGVPYHAAENYVGKMIQSGRRVAICDQVTEPRPGQIVERAVTQILSPGSVFHLDLTAPKENRFMAAVVEREGVFGFAFLDLTTGEFRVTELHGAKAWHDELLRLHPRELIHPSEVRPPKLPDGCKPAVVSHDDWTFEHDHAELFLREHFKVQSLDGFGCSGLRKGGLGAAGALLHYATQTLRAQAGHVLKLLPYSGDDFLVVDAITQRNLELVQPMSHAAGDTTLLKALDKTVTAMGGRELGRWILRPLRSRDPILARQKVVDRWLEDVGRLEDFRTLLHEVRDLERIIGRLAQGSGNARDLQALRLSLDPLTGIKAMAESLQTPLAEELAARIEPQPDLIDLIERAIEPEPPLAVKEGGIIREGFRPEVDELRVAMRDGKAWIADLQNREQERTGIRSLKVRYTEAFGYFIEITRSNLDQVPADYTRKQTLVNAERYITPELKEMEGKLLGAEERSRQLEYKVFLEIREQVVARTAAIQEVARAVAQLDVLASFAVSARLMDYCKPEISTNGRMDVEEGRHPVLEQLLVGEKFVPNDIRLNQDDCRLVILTGPNMAGKSTYIRQVALIALMAHLGSHVPARAATVPVCDRIFTRVGANDDLSRGQSTFMVEMNETANILNNATAQSLVILDEIGRGTSTFDGLSIAWSVAEHLHNIVKCKTLFATHYHELTELSVALTGVKNYNVAVREWHDQIIFLRKIVAGGTDKSYGIQVARLAGLPKEVIARAKEILRNLEENELDATGKPQLARHPEEKPVKKVKKKKGKKQKGPIEVPQMDLFRRVETPGN
ncbi:MAG: DNA mismatch repair protein MutS [Candidatus Methylacidiphilales bacterium]|nr:DNA mismatch repair protein MutS [Candidatus Methylacidiphilales bacterium]